MELLLSEEEIQKRVKDLAQEISQDYKGVSPILIGILRGSFVFLSDLIRHLTILPEIDFMSVSSYNTLTKSSGVVRILKDLERDIGGENVIVDIQIDYVGFVIPNKFVIGYGLDLAEKYRNLPYVATLEESEIGEPEENMP